MSQHSGKVSGSESNLKELGLTVVSGGIRNKPTLPESESVIFMDYSLEVQDQDASRYCQMLWISFHGVRPWSSHSQRIDYAAFERSCSPSGKLTPA
jgi:hypothetical protein